MDNFPSIQSILDDFIQHMENNQPISASELPDIALYMDQVTTFMDNRLEHSKRYEEDKILTKTMINNYAKNHLLPPPDKKKYSKDHMLLLIFIYYFKNILSINDIQKLLTPMTNRYFKNTDGLDMSWLYSHIMDKEPLQAKRIGEDIRQISEEASHIFPEAPKEEGEYLQLLSLVALLSCDVYMKKQLIEKLIDSFSFPENEEASKKKR
ncbi:MAG: DUF1836 domain-containing protein [Clostridia bacterium]|nr:DUF1836 domain-containing protein [Lachnospiraceae bacterium]NCC01606.1 DUF1836 domain-containing protein [Clostridia bacterium]NCD02363.1 DUF1836 domain-containing protein [Clostridia bacterium]